MHPEVFLVRKVQKEGVRDDPVADLDRVPVLDEMGDIFPDPLHDLPILARVVFQKGFVVGQDEVRLLDPDEPFPVGAGHRPVRLDDDERGRLRRRLDDIHADAEAQAAVLVRERGLDQGDVDRHHPPADQIRNLGEEDGGVVGQTPVDRLPGRVADEERVVAEVPFELHVGVGGNPEGPDLEDLSVIEGSGMGFDIVDQGADQMLGLAATRADKDPVSPADMVEHLFFRRELLRIARPPCIEQIFRRFRRVTSRTFCDLYHECGPNGNPLPPSAGRTSGGESILFHVSAHSSDKTSACSRTVCVAFSCLSGG